MDVAPAGAEVAVVTGAVVQGACVQQYAAAAAWVSKQHALVEPQAAADGGTIAMDGRQPACMWQRAADVACMQQHAAERRVCGSVQRQQAGGSSQQYDCNGRQ